MALHEGTLEFETEVGRGTTFTLTFGAEEAPESSRRANRDDVQTVG